MTGTMTRPRVVVAMSGGVDSSVAAGLLLEEGYDVVGVTMRLWTEEDASASRHHRRCCSVEDTDDARAAADAFGTPNPCLACNDRVKFRPLLEHAFTLDADYLATGHYVRVRHSEGGHELLRAVDPDKDQSYVLYTMGQAELAKTLFPVGEYQKDTIRNLARKWRLPNADKPDSADICFIPSGDYRAFVRERLQVAAGAIVDSSGETIGEHEGVANYTIGQRKGLPSRGGGEPMFVIGLEPDTNTVVVGEHGDLMADGLVAEDVTFVRGEAPAASFEAQARIRYRSEPVPAGVAARDGGAEVRFQRPQRAVTPGQALVFYDGERVLGGGTIARRL
jgi:tRNA-specific 2-thiouridylase